MSPEFLENLREQEQRRRILNNQIKKGGKLKKK
jgi:hypothetical protein